MELTETFVVPAAVERVWQLFDDVPEVVSCMPGASVTERVSDDTYKARLTMAVGPIRPTFDVKATVEREDTAREGRIKVHAVDKGGGSQARAQILYRLSPDGDGTAVELVQIVSLTGPLAQFGRTGVIEDINAQMTRQFAERLAAKLALPADGDGADGQTAAANGAGAAQVEQTPSTEIRVLPLFARTVFRRILRLFRRPKDRR